MTRLDDDDDCAPIQEQYRERMRRMAKALDEFLNPGRKPGAPRATGFVLLVFPFGAVDGRRCNYISNGADRADIVEMMRELVERFSGRRK